MKVKNTIGFFFLIVMLAVFAVSCDNMSSSDSGTTTDTTTGATTVTWTAPADEATFLAAVGSKTGTWDMTGAGTMMCAMTFDSTGKTLSITIMNNPPYTYTYTYISFADGVAVYRGPSSSGDITENNLALTSATTGYFGQTTSTFTLD